MVTEHQATDEYWERTSERNLVYLLYQVSDANIQETAYAILHKRLQRYFRTMSQQKNWYWLYTVQDELIADVIERLTRKYETFHGNSLQFKHYLRRVLLDVCTSALRRQDDERPLDAPYYENGVEEAVDVLCSPMNSGLAVSWDWLTAVDTFQTQPITQMLSAQETQVIAQQAFDTLPEKEQELFHRMYHLEQKQSVIAEEMGMKESAVRVALGRARERFLRAIIQAIATRESTLPLDQIIQAIDQLPEEGCTLMTHWWSGETSWRKLGQRLTPPRSQSETKTIFANTLLKLFDILQTR